MSRSKWPDSINSPSEIPGTIHFGISQVLPILVAGDIGGIMCVEQPELHLHPRLQGKLADFFIATAGLSDKVADSEIDVIGRQWLIETHSEALIVRLQRRIREGVLASGDVSILFVEPTDNGSRIVQLHLDGNGNFVDE